MRRKKRKGLNVEAKVNLDQTTTKEPEKDTLILPHGSRDLKAGDLIETSSKAEAVINEVIETTVNAFKGNIHKSFEDGLYSFPYAKHANEFNEICYRWLVFQPLVGSLQKLAESELGEAFVKFREVAELVPAHFQTVLKAMSSGELKLNGKRWPRIAKKPDMGPICNQMDRLFIVSFDDEGNEISSKEALSKGLINFDNPWDMYSGLCAICCLVGEEALTKTLSKQDKSMPLEVGSAVPQILRVLNSSPTGILDQCLNYLSSGRKPRRTNNNRYEIEAVTNSGTRGITFRFTKKDRDLETELSLDVTLENYQGLTQDKNGTVNKVYHYLLNVMFEQRFQQPCVFRTQNLVDLGIYKNVKSAKDNLPKVLAKISNLLVSGEYLAQNRKRKLSASTGTRLITEFQVNTQTVLVYPSQMSNAIDFFGGSYARVPNFVWGLSKNAHLLAYEIFMRARQETKKVASGEPFTVKTTNISDKLGLPTAEEVELRFNRKYREKIINPIDKAIAEIRTESDKAEGGSLTIEMVGMIEAVNIKDYMANGKILVTLGDEWAQHCTAISETIEENKRIRKSKLETERAKAQVRIEKNTIKKLHR